MDLVRGNIVGIPSKKYVYQWIEKSHQYERLMGSRKLAREWIQGIWRGWEMLIRDVYGGDLLDDLS